MNSSKLPCGVHELHEVIVVVDGRGHCRVVFVPLLTSESAVLVCISEVLEKLHEHLIFSHLAFLDLRVEFSVVHSSEP